MKGHTKIELTNVKTGEVQVIEEDNIVTNWLSELFQNRTLYMNDSFATARDRMLWGWDSEVPNRKRTPFTEFGGLLMFKEQFEADAETYYPPGNVTMTAHASDNQYSGADLTRGSFNVNLSSYDFAEGKVTLVWDFNMEQGNGTIGTVCLCNHADGQIGYGSAYDSEDSNLGKAPFYHHTSPYAYGITAYGSHMCILLRRDYPLDALSGNNSPNTYFNSKLGYIPIWLSTANNTLTLMSLQGLMNDNLEFAVVDLDCSSINPLYEIYRTQGPESYTEYAVGDYHVRYVDVPVQVTDSSSITNYYPDKYYGCLFEYLAMWSGLDFEGNFWFSRAHRHYYSSMTSNTDGKMLKWTAGAKMPFTKLNLSTMESTEYEVTNTTGADIIVNCGYDMSTLSCLTSLCEYNGYLIIRGDNAHLYAINLQNNSDVREIVYDDGTPVLVYKHANECNGTAYAGNAVRYGWAVTKIGNHLIINDCGGGFAIHSASADGNMLIVNSDFVARKLSTARRSGIPEHMTNSTNDNRNICGASLFCSSDSPICLGTRAIDLRQNYSSGANMKSSWSATEKYMSSTVYLSHFAYKPLGLITINTLAEPLTKTADMTMRITYTLTT